MFDPSWEKLLIVLVIALVVLGPKKLPEVSRSLGKGIREFKDGVTGKDDAPVAAPAAIAPPTAPPAYTPRVATDPISGPVE
jgi:sec-independent protein translocase protein TatA